LKSASPPSSRARTQCWRHEGSHYACTTACSTAQHLSRWLHHIFALDAAGVCIDS
jgi:hypothetical protein